MGALAAFLLAAATTPASAPAAVAPPPELMRRLAEQAARLQRGLEDLSIEVGLDYREIGKKGQIVHEGLSTAVIDFHGPKRVTRVLRATRDGKDALKEAQKDAEENDQKERKPVGPFEAWNQPKHRFVVLGPAPGGLLKLGISPADGKAHDIFQGEALVDPATGEAVRVSVSPTKLPAFVDRLQFVVDYGVKLPGIGRTLSHITVDGQGGFLFFRRHEWIGIDIKYLAVGGKPVVAQ
jgi:hypothetical protein